MVNPLSLDTFWFNKQKFEEAERIFYEAKYGGKKDNSLDQNKRNLNGQEFKSNVSVEIDKVRNFLKNSLSCSAKTLVLNEKYEKLVKEKKNLNKTIEDLRNQISKLEVRVNSLEKSCPVKESVCSKPAAKKDDDDDIDLFGSDDESDAEAEALREKRAAEHAAKKSKKPALIAKSSVVLEVKPWDDETDLEALEKSVRSIDMDGLVWGASKFVPVAFGLKKLQIVCVVEDDKVSIEELSEKIEAFEDYIQSVDVAAFNKI